MKFLCQTLYDMSQDKVFSMDMCPTGVSKIEKEQIPSSFYVTLNSCWILSFQHMEVFAIHSPLDAIEGIIVAVRFI